jgi:hypothetical protein
MLTNVAIKAFKPASKPYKKADGAGLFLLIQPNGSKVWRFAYRFRGKQKLLSGGLYPATTLLAARGWRDMMKHQLALGLDPSAERLASTVLNESGLFEPDWIECQLAHQPRGVRAAYNSARYLAHRRPMMQWWADYLDSAERKGMVEVR